MTSFQATPSVKRQDLYRLYDADGQLLYIGISYSAIARFAQHRADKAWIGDVCRIEIESHDVDRAEIERIEREAIITEKPKHNKVHNGVKAPSGVPDGVAEFFAGALAVGPHLHQIAELVEAMLAQAERHCTTITQAELNNTIAAYVGAMRLADCCDQCGTTNYPIGIRRESPTWVTAAYSCHGCWHHRWTCGWAA